MTIEKKSVGSEWEKESTNRFLYFGNEKTNFEYLSCSLYNRTEEIQETFLFRIGSHT